MIKRVVPNVAKGYRLFRHREGSPGKRFKGGERRFSANLQVARSPRTRHANPLLLSELAREAEGFSRTNFSP